MEKTSPRVCTIEAPSKINLHLRIKEKRPDGFHALESLFAALSLADTLRFDLADEKGDCHLLMNWEPSVPVMPMEIPMKENLVYRAVSLFRERTGFKNGVRIRLDKRIPVGAGLGGGSSDAASTLMALNILAREPLSLDELEIMAASLGSDVPFFLAGGAAFVSGRGELIEPVKAPQGLWVVLVKPPFASGTASAFRLLDEARERETGEQSSSPKKDLSKKDLSKKALSKKDLILALAEDPLTWPYRNDFLEVFLGSNSPQRGGEGANAGVYPVILEKLREEGASFAGLSGSGSCCFGVFKAKETAERAKMVFGVPEYFTGLTFFLAQKANAVVEY